MSTKPLQTLYNSLRDNNYDVPDNYDSFERTLTAKGKEGVKNRQLLYKSLRDNNFDVPDNYQSFANTLFAPSKVTTPTQKVVANDMLNDAKQIVKSGNERLENVASYQNQNPFNQNMLELGGVNKRKIGESGNVRKGDMRFNEGTGKFEQTYVTSEGARTSNKQAAAIEQQNIDELYEAEKNPELNTRRNLESLANKVDEAFTDYSQNKVGALSRGVYYGQGIGMNASNSDLTWQTLATAKDALSNAQKIVREADEGIKSGNLAQEAWMYGKGVWRGFKDGVFDINTWLDNASANETRALNAAIKASDEGKLTEEQRMLLDAKAIELAVNSYFGSKVGLGYKVGGINAQSIPFMIEMAINPASAVGKGLAAKVTKYALKRFAPKLLGKIGKAATKAVVKGAQLGAKAVGDAAGAYAMAGTTGLPRTIADAQDRMRGDIVMGRDWRNNIVYGGHTQGEDAVTAFGKALTASAIENYTEMSGSTVGNLVGGTTKRATSAGAKLADKLGLKTVSQVLGGESVGKVGKLAKLITDFEDKTQWHGSIDEYLEEVDSNVLNALLVGDMTLDTDEETGVFNPKLNLETALGVSLFGGALSTLKTIGYKSPKKRAIADMDKADKRATELYGGVGNWSGIRNTIAFGGDEDVKDVLNKVFSDKQLTREQKAAALDYAKQTQRYKGVLQGEKLKETDAKVRQLDAAYANGYNLVSAEDMQQAKDRLEVLRQSLSEFVADENMQQFDNEPLIALHTIKDNEQWTNEEKQTALDYVNAKATYDGMLQKVRDDIDSQIAASDEVIDSRIASETIGGDGMVHPATLKADNKQVYIISGNVVTLEDGTIDVENSDNDLIIVDKNGVRDFISVNKLRSVDAVMDAEQMKQEAADNIRESVSNTAAAKIDGSLSFLPNDVYEVVGEDGQPHKVQVLQQIDEENVSVVVDGQVEKPVTMSKDEVQDMYDAKRRSNLKQERDAEERDPFALYADVTIKTPDGDVNGTVVTVENEDGLIEVQTDAPINGKSVVQLTRQQLEEMNAPQEQESVEAEEDVIPQDAKGNPDYLSVTPERAYTHIYTQSGLKPEYANKFVDANIAAAQKELDKAKNKKEPDAITGLREYQAQLAEWESARGAAQAKLDFWNNVKAQRQAANDAARAEADFTARKQAESIQQDGNTSPSSEESEPITNEQNVEVTEEAVTKPTIQEDIAIAEQETDTNPTDKQKAAGNYKKGHVKIDGYDVTIENPKGSIRSGKDANGKEWSITMNNTYGYIRGTEEVDGDHIDVFLSDNPEQGEVFVIDQVNPQTGEFDEHKVMYGFANALEAKIAYFKNYSKGWGGFGKITGVSKGDFKKWIESSHRKTKPFAEYKGVKVEAQRIEEQRKQSVANTEGDSSEEVSNSNESNEGDEPKGKLATDIREQQRKEQILPNLGGKYSLSQEKANNGEVFYQNEDGNTTLAIIPDEIFDRLGIKPVLFKLTETMGWHVFDHHKKEAKFNNIGDAIDFVLSIINNVDHVRLGRDNSYIFSVENGRSRVGKRAVTIMINSETGEFMGIRTSGYETLGKLIERPLLWERGADFVPEDVATPTITTIESQQGDETSSRAKGQSNDVSADKDKTSSANKQGNEEKSVIQGLENYTEGETDSNVGTTTEESTKQPTQKIEDVGEKIGGARKDIVLDYIKKANIDGTKLSEIFPKPNFQNLIKAGVPTDVLAEIKSFYGFAKEMARRKRLFSMNIDVVRMLSKSAQYMLSKSTDMDIDDIDTAEGIYDRVKDILESNCFIAAVKKVVDTLGEEYLDVDFFDVHVPSKDEYKEDKHGYYKSKDGKRYIRTYVGAGDTKTFYNVGNDFLFDSLDDALDVYVKKVQLAHSVSSKARPKFKIGVYKSGLKDIFIALRINKDVIRLKDGFSTTKDALKYLNDYDDELQTAAARIADERRNTNRSKSNDDIERDIRNIVERDRIGKDWREGKNVTAENFMNTFGFRGVEFGNWANQNERQLHLNKCYDAFMDMAELLGVSPKALSLGGKLGFAFGARGRGRAHAHYEPMGNVINLTKNRGAGCVAHEWFHALDYYLSGNVLSPSTENKYKTDTREELKNAFNGIMASIDGTEYEKTAKRYDVNKETSYWSNPTELGARAFEAFVKQKLYEKGQTNDYLSAFNVSTEESLRGANGSLYPVGDEMAKINNAFQNVFDTIEEKIDEEGNAVLYQKSVGDGVLSPQEVALRDGLIDLMRGYGVDVETDDVVGQRVIDEVSGEVKRMSGEESERRKERNKINATIDHAISSYTGKDIKEVRRERLEKEAQRRKETKEIYEIILSGNYNDVSLQQINKYLADVTPYNPYGRRLSERLPQRVERKMYERKRENAIDALFSRASESSVAPNERVSASGRRKIEEKKKELLEQWAKASGNWHTDLKDFTNDDKPFDSGKDSDVYVSKDGNSVIKLSKGKPGAKRFRPDIDNIPLFNYVFPNSAYSIVGYGDFGNGFVRILKQPYIDFSNSTPLSVEERVEYMEKLGFHPINKDNTAFSNDEIIVADLQKGNIVKDADGNIRVIDADCKLHTKDVGGKYSYLPVEHDTYDADNIREMRVYHGSAADFDRFDHSHMGEGEGAQAYGWGSYVTEVEGIGKTYANSMARNGQPRILYTVEIPDDNGKNYLDWTKPVPKDLLDKIKGEKFGHVVLINSEGDFYEFYQSLSECLNISRYFDSPFENDFTWTDDMYNLMSNMYGIETDDNIYYIPNDYLTLDGNTEEKLELAQRINRNAPSALVNEDLYDFEDNDDVEQFIHDIEVQLQGEIDQRLREKDQELASKYLNGLGFVGIKYPAQYRSGGREDGASNYVIFNEKDLKIIDKVKFFRTSVGEVYGFTYKGRIYIDPRVATAETPIHEYAHLWVGALKKANPKAWETLKKRMEGMSDVMEYVKGLYPELKGDDLLEEVFTHYSGRRGAERLRAEQKAQMDAAEGIFNKASVIAMFEKLRGLLKDFWNKARDLFAGEVEGVDKLSGEDFADMMLGDLLGGFILDGGGDGVKYRRVVGGNSGYVGYSKSKRAVKAENNGLRNKSQMDKEFADEVNEIIKHNNPDAPKVTLKQIKDSLSKIKVDEWHHTSMYGNRTDYYSAETIAEYFVPETDEETKNREDYESQRDNAIHQYNSLVNEIEKETYDVINKDDEGFFRSSMGAKVHVSRSAYSGKTDIINSTIWWENRLYDGEELRFEHPDVFNNIQDEYTAAVEDARGYVAKTSADKFNKVKELVDIINKIRYQKVGDGVEAINARFNEDLDAFKENKHQGLIHLGKPLEILKACGVNAESLTLSPTVLHRHLKKHGLAVEDIKGLAKAVQTPILVYKHGKNMPNMVVVTEMDVKGGKLSVSLELDENGNVVEISNIRSIHSKDAMIEMERLSKFSEEELKEALRWVDKEKVSDWLLRLPYMDERTKNNPKQLSAAKVIETFENPKISTENFREGDDTPYMDYEEKLKDSRRRGYTKQQLDRSIERHVRLMRERAEETVGKLGIADNVTILEDNTGLEGRKAKAKGWYDVESGKIVVVLGNHGGVSDVVKTILHEGVAHYGLRKLFGENFNTFLDNVYSACSDDIRANIDRLAEDKGLDKRTATEEYLAGLAEDVDFDRPDLQDWWNNIKRFFLDMLEKIGLKDYSTSLTDNELRYILWSNG